MIGWSKTKLDRIKRISADPTSNPIEARLAEAELLAADGQTSTAEQLVVREFETFWKAGCRPGHLAVSLVRSLIVVQRLELAAQLLTERHKPGARIELNMRAPGRGDALITLKFLLPECLSVTLDSAVLRNDKTDIEVLWLDWIFPVFAHYARNWPGDNGVVSFSNWDDAIAPGLAMCSNRPDCFLIPDNVFVPTQGYAHLRAETERLSVPWAERRPLAFWRGSTTGRPADPPRGWRSLPRIRLCEIAQGHEALIDAGVSNVIQISDPEAENQIRSLGLMRPYVPPSDFNYYKYQIDIDGNTNAWPGLFQKLIGGNAVLKVGSPTGHRQWYYDRLTPWINYVPIEADMTDLLDKVRWLQVHDPVAERIGIQGRALAMSLDYAGELNRSVRTISAALRFFAKRPELDWQFTEQTPHAECLVAGWDGFAVDGGALTSGQESQINLLRPVTFDNFVLTVDVSPASELTQRLTVIVNGEVLHNGSIDGRDKIDCVISHQSISRAEKLTVRLLHPDAGMAASMASPLDDRILGVVLHRITLTPAATCRGLVEHASLMTHSWHADIRGGPELAARAEAEAARYQVVTHCGTVLYFDPEIGDVRHGSEGTVPHNLVAIVEQETASLAFIDADRMLRAVRIDPAPDKSLMTNIRTTGSIVAPGFSLVWQSSDFVGLSAAGLFLCAETDGRVTLSRTNLGLWERFRLVLIGHESCLDAGST